MARTQSIEQFTHTPFIALSVVDRFAQALRLRGEFPPPLGEISCEIVEATAPANRTFEPARMLSTFRSRSGYVMVDGTFAQPGERTRRWPLGPGTYRIRVRGTLYQDAEFLLRWPPEAGERRVRLPQANPPDSVYLLPSATYPLPDVSLNRFQLGPTIIRGSAFSDDGTPIEGAVAEVINLPWQPLPTNLPPLVNWSFLRAVSGANGDWALVLPNRRYFDPASEVLPQGSPVLTMNISVRVGYPRGPVTTVQQVILGSEHSVRNTALRGQVTGAGGRPIAGARIETTVSAATSASRHDGSWFLYFDLNQVAVPNISVTATTPDQTSATASATLRPQATVVVPAFHFS